MREAKSKTGGGAIKSPLRRGPRRRHRDRIAAMFHVKQGRLGVLTAPARRLFSDAEFLEDRVQHVLHIDASRDPAERPHGEPHILGR